MNGASVTWTSSNRSAATVSSAALVTAVADGTTNITAKSGRISASIQVTVEIENPDRDALVALYRSTDGPNWRNNNDRVSEEPINNWYGVRTNGDGRVTELRLGGNNLDGTIPSKIGKLSKLEHLALHSNQIRSRIPSAIGDLTALTQLALYDNQLSGGIPSSIRNLGSLRLILLNGNELTGSIPGAIGSLTALTLLGLWDNQLSGGIPSSIGSLTNLRELIVTRNAEMSGPLPGALTNTPLEKLHLRGTQLCAPNTSAFQTWLDGINDVTPENVFCDDG